MVRHHAGLGTLLDLGSAARYLSEYYSLPVGDARLSPVAYGLTGQIWKLSNGSDRFAVKESFWEEIDEEAAWREAAFTRAVRDVGVGCPESVLAGNGEYLCRLPVALSGALVRVHSWVDGEVVRSTRGTVARWVGRTLGRLHALRFPARGEPDRWYEKVPSPEEWRDLLRRVRWHHVPWGRRLENLLPAIDEISTLVRPIPRDELITCHLDFSPDNVLAGPSGTFHLVDWENSGPGSAEQELAFVLLTWHAHGDTVDEVAVADTMSAYREAGGPGRVRDISSCSLFVATVVNNLYTQASVAITADVSQEHRERGRANAEAALGDFPSSLLLENLVHLARSEGQVREERGLR
ncbi:phosphotransferase enzyme family protein [Streptoalloteichus hindustanus]|uniref:Phosphotransferase enzyme family protein n=1 Tax=Streptoalloteichus hindustanus TaxID=2017 RepID=A0A1M5IHN3_STRHI|nr:phosphotransferase [Streptoalloteichus hindustanus]SHG27303.1 Phosphotransferase enzyme family protein [Streptoalloteichus hindustanus]